LHGVHITFYKGSLNLQCIKAKATEKEHKGKGLIESKQQKPPSGQF